MYYTRFFLLFLCCSTGLLYGQSYSGFSTDNYAGVHGLLLNPANVAASRTGFELHIASASGALSNDYLKFDGLNVQKAFDEDEFETAVISRTQQDERSLYANADVLGPSLLMSLGKKTGLGLITRARALYNVANMNGQLVEYSRDDFSDASDFTFSQQDHYSTLHGWGEFAVVLGTVLIDTEHHLLKGGASVKYLQGLGAVYTYGERLDGAYDADEDRLTVEGDIAFGRTNDFYYEDISLEDRAGGFGFDFGLVYEWKPGSKEAGLPYKPYRLKLGASLLDVGNIRYDNAYRADYLPAGSLPASRIDAYDDLEFQLSENFDGTESDETTEINLPTSVQLLVDLRLTRSLYASAQYSMAHAVSDNRLSNTVTNSLTLMARMEGRGMGLYLPYTVRPGQSNTLGAGLRLGLFTVGSSSIVTQLLGDGGYAADVYAAVKFPFHRKGKAQDMQGADAGAKN